MREKKEEIADFIKKSISEAGASGAVVGLSGGVDSAVVAHLCAEALGPKMVLGLFLPYEGITSREDEEHASLIAERTGIAFRTIPINKVVDAFEQAYPGSLGKVAQGNIKPRARMVVFYMHANELHRLVAGTGNRSELLTGYFTKFGDGCADFLPIGNLYKTEVLELANELGIPKEIIDRVPSAGLWEGQSDEQELGISYSELDQILKAHFDEGKEISQTAESTGIDEAKVASIIERCRSASHKLSVSKTP